MLPTTWEHTICEWASQNKNIVRVFVFGSFARAEQSPDSDLDLAIQLADDEDADDLPEWKCELQAMLPIPVDLQLYSKHFSPDIVCPAVEADGIAVYSSDPRGVDAD